MIARDYRQSARDALSGKWVLSSVVALVALLLGGAYSAGTSSISIDLSQYDIQLPPLLITLLTWLLGILVVQAVISFVIGGAVRLGHCRYLLEQRRGMNLEFKTLFSQFFNFGKGFLLQLLINIFTILWTLLLIIPGIVAAYSYAMAPFILAETPEYAPLECIGLSKKMMKGHRFELFCLDLSFIGWAILCLFTLGLGTPVLTAYRAAARAAFYESISCE